MTTSGRPNLPGRDALLMRLPDREQLALITVAAITATAVTGAFAYRWRVRAQSVSQQEIEAYIAALHTELALDEHAAADTGVIRGWCARAEDHPDRTPFYWHAAAAGGPDPRYQMGPVRWVEGWARTVRQARAQRDHAVHRLMHEVADA